ncbi:uncharacterized protein TNCV_413581 [Trichonephila clavipes]|nr:uncharacterized protein TNCV_413581 [Trichonephila clavipes]
METVSVLIGIFKRPEANGDLRYTSYYGDGDSKAFNNGKDMYGIDSKVKYECIGHVQKRVGSRLRKLKKSTKGVGGKGKMTDKFIDTPQNYFRIAVRSNGGNLSNMENAIIVAPTTKTYVWTMLFWIRYMVQIRKCQARMKAA